MASIWRLLFATLALSVLTAAQTNPRACNNSPELCSRPYNNVTYLGAHDSAFIRNQSNGYSVAANQFFPSPVQLDAGVRLLTSQLHKVESITGDTEWHLCHSYCELYDAGLARGWLGSIKVWLDANPDEVVTILLVNQEGASAAAIDAEFQAAGIAHYAYTPSTTTAPATTWPTLNQLIETNKRLIVFIQPLTPATNTEARYLLDQFTFTFENNYDNKSPSDFSCDANRPDDLKGKTATALSSGRLPLMNHFLYDDLGVGDIEIPAVEDADVTNAPSGSAGNLGDAAAKCKTAYGKAPSYIVVDFVNVGPAVDTVDKMNELGPDDIVGRRPLPNQVYSSGPGPTQTVALGVTESTATTRPAPSSIKFGNGNANPATGLAGLRPSAAVLGSVLGMPLVAGLRDAFL